MAKSITQIIRFIKKIRFTKMFPNNAKMLSVPEANLSLIFEKKLIFILDDKKNHSNL